jgi:micrococcal nuclease
MFNKIKEALASFKKQSNIKNEEKLYYYKGLVTYVVDGDTFDILVSTGFDQYSLIRFRLFYYNTPEVRGDERERGLEVKQKVVDMLEGKEVIIKSIKKGSFSRYLAEIWVGDIHLGDYLYKNGDAEIWKNNDNYLKKQLTGKL